MKEYLEPGLSLKQLKSELLPASVYQPAHQGLVLFCHDVFIAYQDGILLILRNNEPASDILWPLGGRVERGMSALKSLRLRIKKEAGLELEQIEELGWARTYFKTDPFGHGHGTDSVNQVFFAHGIGDLQLDQDHHAPTIVKEQDFVGMKSALHPYVSDYLEIVYKRYF
ncbi:MAG: NUDIX domain-containing protein [Candidatus Cyclobacteriaceae bacterium M3_2C_046]